MELINQNQNDWKVALELLEKIKQRIQEYNKNAQKCNSNDPLLNRSVEQAQK